MQLFKTRTFRWWEVGLIKLCLISLGIIVAYYWGGYLFGMMWLWWALFVATGIYFILKLIREE
ncbi:MAG: hypothetical protein A3C84_00705 [Candidatus Ryanbacteria bacterium RIFCSPHIGHO2_02_FULL_48_12]|uniref:Uncharacterized protein n=1 Tax=Candidatus Ryanbacteria bacterium RIFCSPHIGHO2_01_FULL_48_27 TaxID=1802115 RepID=A0A1G2G6A5_9BACT|nr:MAG: hypothetical protein A2756_02625 [Candidatus Ryanbacteria bacterium RIFCSPHIGHO2_01_FULL_48_27]OGZ49302.1 MAG: hypothetical protein A3C84_00705 [Candidatus Ryanbacteria bacterium RIFCSPHIGHO2_02_FULL_48_12]